MDLYSAGIQMGHRLYNIPLSQDIRKKNMASEILQELLVNQEYTSIWSEILNLIWTTKVLCDFQMKADGVSITSGYVSLIYVVQQPDGLHIISQNVLI